MDTSFPDGDAAKITLTMRSPKALTLAMRRPVWAGDGFAVSVNGVQQEQPPLASLHDATAGGRGAAPGNEAVQHQASVYVELKRTWKTGDTIELSLPKSLRLEPTPDNRQVAAIMWGPLVLAANLGPRREGGRGAANAAPAAGPVFVVGERPVAEWIAPVASRSGDFRASQDVSLSPFYRTHRCTYSVYFDIK
jgi:hypothetical protein